MGADDKPDLSINDDDCLMLGLLVVSIMVDRSGCEELTDHGRGFGRLIENSSAPMPNPPSLDTSSENFREVGFLFASMLSRWIGELERDRARKQVGYRDGRPAVERKSRTLTEFFNEFVGNYYGKPGRNEDGPRMLIGAPAYIELGWRCIGLTVKRAWGEGAGKFYRTDIEGNLCATLEAEITPAEYEELGRYFIDLMTAWALGHDCRKCIALRGYATKDYLNRRLSRRRKKYERGRGGERRKRD
jgi:hypothetical protein